MAKTDPTQKTKRVGMDLTEGSVWEKLVIFALPMILTNLVQQLYSMVDLIIIGQYSSTVGTVAVSVGSELMDLMTPIANAFSMGAQIYMAQLAGAKETERMKQTASTIITLLMSASVIFMVLAFAFYNPILKALNCPIEASGGAAAYMLITALGMPVVFGYTVICSLLRAVGESKRPLMFVTIAATANIFLDLLLVAVIPLDVAGVAIATVGAQIGAFTASFVYFYKYREAFGFEFKRSYFKIYKSPLRIIIKLGIPQLIRTLSVHLSQVWVKVRINDYGLIPSATYRIGNKIERLLNVVNGGIDSAAGAMIGQNLGARKYERIKRIMWVNLLITLAFAGMVVALFLLMPRQLYRAFTKDAQVMDYGVIFLRIMSVGCVVVAFSGTYKAMSTGAGAAMLSLIIGILDGLTRVLACLFFFHVLAHGVASFFWGAALCQLIPGIVSLGYYLSGKWRTKKLLFEK